MVFFKYGSVAVTTALALHAQIAITGVATTSTQAILQYTSPVAAACSVQVADMNRAIAITSGAQAGGQVTLRTNAPHGLLAGAVVYIENSGVPGWDGWQAIVSAPTTSSLVFSSAATGSTSQGNVGVLVDDVNPALFAGADQDSRPGNVTTGQTQVAGSPQTLARVSGRSRSFVVGLRYAQFASDGSRHSRALQANSRHHFTLTCGSQSIDQEFRTQNIPLGDTHNDGPLADRNNPGQYAYPTIQWPNQAQTLIDPVSGLRSFRATAPRGTPSLTQTFVTAIDLQSAWQNPSAPLNNFGGAAMFTGPCRSGTCPLFLRADSLTLPGGATYTTGGSSLDWVTVTVGQASINNSACVGDDCKIVACLTVNGQTCASLHLEASLTGTPANYTFGTGGLMDLWQGSGPPGVSRVDASQSTGVVNYVAATGQATLVSGYPFNIKWTAGSTINIAGGQYQIASVQSELQLTLTSGPNSNLNQVTYSANNFGVLVWKKTLTADRVSIGYTTYVYGSTGMPGWPAAAHNTCSPAVSVAGLQGYNCFIDSEIYWFAGDGSDVRDLGLVAMTYYPDGRFSDGAGCGSSNSAYEFDPQDGDTWYCMVTVYFDNTRQTLIKAHYNGAHSRYTPGSRLPDCGLNGNVQPCLTFTIMQPNKSDSVSQSAPLFNPDYAASGFTPVYWFFGGVSPDGAAEFYAYGAAQDTPGWVFVYTLGDRTPAGTDAGSVHIIAGASTYRKAPQSWCTIHDMFPPDSGWIKTLSNAMTFEGASGTYSMTLTSPALTTTAGAPGGLNACPINPFGVTGNNCTAITVNGEPTRASDGSTFQNVQVGDVVQIDSEPMRVVAVNGPTSFTAQRGYPSGIAASHSSTTLTMLCGLLSLNGYVGLWNYVADPYGANATWNTVVNDPLMMNGHTYIGGGIPSPPVTISPAFSTSFNNPTLCPLPNQICDQTRLGYNYTALTAPQSAVAINPLFAGVKGIGDPNGVDTHPGPCFNGWCMDARPMLGGDNLVVAPSTSPFVNVTGHLWKASGAQSILHPKIMTTLAYAGRAPLVDVSGPTSLIDSSSADSYKYCYANLAGECVSGSSPGDVYVNAPYVSHPYCSYPGIAIQGNDTNGICIGDLGAYTGNLAQVGYTTHDLVGAGIRNLGPNYSQWTQFSVYWNSDATPSGFVLASQSPWLDGVRTDDLVTVLPPYPASDGVARNSFLPVAVTIDPAAALSFQSAIVEFGYAENGDPGSYYCVSRQETCVAASSAINPSTPFYFEQSESWVGVPCATGCTITIPALSQRILYYRWRYLNSTGQIVGSSAAHVVVTP
jgi:hypothetical protein